MLLLMPSMLSAQQIRVEEFECMRKPFLRPRPFSVDKEHAILDLETQESGFEFSLGMQPIQAVEGDGMLTLLLPDKTAYFTIKHADYGVLTWKVPGGVLRKKKHYKAQLLTDSPTKEFSLCKQWAVVHVEPSNAIVTIDSTTHSTMTGKVQALLPVGSHSIRVEAPFYEELADTFFLSDTARLDKHIRLQPQYSYLEVTAGSPDAEIRLDGHLIGKGMARTGRIASGVHELTLHRGALCIHRSMVTLASGERRILSVGETGTQHQSSVLPEYTAASSDVISFFVQEEHPDTFHIRAFDDSTEIWVNREMVGHGSWKGVLPSGTIAVSTRKDGLESRTQYVQVGGGSRQQVKMPTPYASYGWLSISCNVVDAQVWLDGKLEGSTPCIIPNLHIRKKYLLRITKDGYKPYERILTIRGNDMLRVDGKLKTGN
jgi:hypothetical protein